MKLWEAMKALENGKKVRRLDWEPGEYIMLDSFHEVIDNTGTRTDKEIFDNIHAHWEIYKDRDKMNKAFDYLPII